MDRDYLKARTRQLAFLKRKGQRVLHGSTLLVVGSSGAGSPAILVGALAGFGEILAVDPEPLKPPNLHRFVLGGVKDLDRWKSKICARRMGEMDPTVRVSAVVDRLESSRGVEALTRADAVAVCTDVNEPRTFANDRCVRLRKPLLDVGSGAHLVDGELRMMGCRASLYMPGHACLECIYLDAEPMPQSHVSWLPLNLLAVSVGMDALVAYLTGYRPVTANHFVFDALTGRLDAMMVASRPDCPLCAGQGCELYARTQRAFWKCEGRKEGCKQARAKSTKRDFAERSAQHG
jgi:molybdopterin/thiamine biosynthesis adenylyltransferase